MQSADKLTLEPAKKRWWANIVPANFMLSQDCLTMPDLPQLMNLLQIGCEPSHSFFLLCFCLFTHRVFVLGSRLISFICRQRALYFPLSLVSICSHGPSCRPAMRCVSTSAHCLQLCHCHVTACYLHHHGYHHRNKDRISARSRPYVPHLHYARFHPVYLKSEWGWVDLKQLLSIKRETLPQVSY